MNYFAVLLLFVSSFASAQDDGGLAVSRSCHGAFDRCVREATTLREFRDRAGTHSVRGHCGEELNTCLMGHRGVMDYAVRSCNFRFEACAHSLDIADCQSLREARQIYRGCVSRRLECYERVGRWL